MQVQELGPDSTRGFFGAENKTQEWHGGKGLSSLEYFGSKFILATSTASGVFKPRRKGLRQLGM